MMMRIKPLLAAVGLCAAVIDAAAIPTITFEETPSLNHLDIVPSAGPSNPLSDFYTLSSHGVSFSGAHAIRDSFMPDPTFFDQGPYATIQPPRPIDDLTDGTVMAFKGSASDENGGLLPATTFTFGTRLISITFDYSSSIDIRFQAFSGDAPISAIRTIALNNSLADGLEPECSDFVTAKFCNWTTSETFIFGANENVTSLKFFTNSLDGNLTLMDNVSIEMAANVPEPSTYALMALGLAGIALISRRRREL